MQRRNFSMRRQNSEEITLKRVIRALIGSNKQIGIFLANNNTFSITQFGIMPLEDGDKIIPLRGSVRIAKASVIRFHNLLTWILLRFPEQDIAKEDRSYIENLRKISQQQMRELERNMLNIGFAPTDYHGEDFLHFNQPVEDVGH
jgi:hypothetical protein